MIMNPYFIHKKPTAPATVCQTIYTHNHSQDKKLIYKNNYQLSSKMNINKNSYNKEI